MRKMKNFMPEKPEPEEEPVRAVLAVRKAPVMLTGSFANYCVGADRDVVEVETTGGSVLMQIPADKLGAFIDELITIHKNIGKVQPMEFWG